MPAVIGLMTAAVFALDVAIPLGHVGWLLYLLPLWFCSRLVSPAAPLRYALLCSFLLGVGAYFAPAGVDIRRVVELGITPRINTGIAHREAGVGQVGAGLVRPPLSVFEDALLAFADRYLE